LPLATRHIDTLHWLEYRHGERHPIFKGQRWYICTLYETTLQEHLECLELAKPRTGVCQKSTTCPSHYSKGSTFTSKSSSETPQHGTRQMSKSTTRFISFWLNNATSSISRGLMQGCSQVLIST
jgi:hypothetical protein